MLCQARKRPRKDVPASNTTWRAATAHHNVRSYRRFRKRTADTVVCLQLVTSSHDCSRWLHTPTIGRFVGLFRFPVRRTGENAAHPLLLSRQQTGRFSRLIRIACILHTTPPCPENVILSAERRTHWCIRPECATSSIPTNTTMSAVTATFSAFNHPMHCHRIILYSPTHLTGV